MGYRAFTTAVGLNRADSMSADRRCSFWCLSRDVSQQLVPLALAYRSSTPRMQQSGGRHGCSFRIPVRHYSASEGDPPTLRRGIDGDTGS